MIIFPKLNAEDQKEHDLAIFVDELKDHYKKGELSKAEIELCESIPEWTWEKKEE